ncbi:hypothetical protein ACFYS8_18785 [Kitasatospora sp. NPDC004615]|uniref:hypothetical protein n=1 Tax=Kitasatospora sp. NPDC004615 TaxID=3364017 RepID=UPI0036886686
MSISGTTVTWRAAANARLADRVVVVDRGRIVQTGTWTELAHHEGPFRELPTLQADRTIPARRPA